MPFAFLKAQPKLDFRFFDQPKAEIHDGFLDEKGVLWLATSAGVARFDGSNFRLFQKKEGQKNALAGNEVLDLEPSADGQLWAVCLGGGLSKIDPRTGKIENFHPATDLLTAVLTEGRDSVWLGTMNSGMALFDQKTGKTSLFSLGSDKIDEQPQAWNSVSKMQRDPADGRFLLVAANGRGLVRFDTRTGKAVSDTLVFPPLLDPKKPRPSGFRPEWFKIETGIISPIGRTGSAAMCVFADRADEIWLGTWSCGLVRVDRKSGLPEFFVPDEASFLSGNPFRNIVTGISRRSENELFVSTLDAGLFVFDIEKRLFQPVFGQNQPKKKLAGLFAAADGRLFVFGKGEGLWLADGAAPLFHFEKTPAPCFDPTGDEEAREVSDFAFDAGRKSVWFTVRKCDFIFRKSLETGAIEAIPFRPAPFSAQLFDAVLVDQKGRVWAGGGFDLTGKNALWLFDEKQKVFAPFNGFARPSGLRDSTRLFSDTLPNYLIINELRAEHDDDIYVETQKNERFVINFSTSSVLPFFGQASQKKPFQAAEKIWFGSKNGFLTASLFEFENQKKRKGPTVALTDFSVFGASILGDSLLVLPSEIALRAGQNFWTAHFSALDFGLEKGQRFAWMLENFDADWRFCDGCGSATYTNLAGGEYVFRVKIVDEKGERTSSNEAFLHILIRPPFWKTKLFLLSMAAFLAYFAWLFMRWRLKMEREKALFRQQESDLKTRLAELEMTALRGQMNPHFIFNCLNSISTFIEMNETDRAAEQLSKFSKLIRLVLDNSRSERVSLGNELEMLRFYVELEQMRFEGRFDFELKMEPGLDLERLEIPPMIVQPFVENAIWHGLLHRKGAGGRLRVAAFLDKNAPDFLVIEVEDNGIGRAKSAELRSKSATLHKSHGLKITAERLAILSQKTGGAARAEVVDLPDGSGTRVVLRLPI